MSDLMHARKAEEFLASAKQPTENAESAYPAELSLIHATLATARALRELETAVRLGLNNIRQDAAAVRPVRLMHFTDEFNCPVWINLDALAGITVDDERPDSHTVVATTGGHSFIVTGSASDVSAAIFQVVG